MVCIKGNKRPGAFFQIKIRGKWQEEEQLFIEVAL